MPLQCFVWLATRCLQRADINSSTQCWLLRYAWHCQIHRLLPCAQGTYHMYVSRVEFMDPLMFALAWQQNEARSQPMPGSQEKILFAWYVAQHRMHACVLACSTALMSSLRHEL